MSNLDEAAQRTGLVLHNEVSLRRGVALEVADIASLRRAAKAIAALGPRPAASDSFASGPRAVWLKGGHLSGAPTDVFWDGKSFLDLPAERIETKDTHGTGCTLSAALATELARGLDLHKAVLRAKLFITEAIRHSLRLGKGCGPTDPLAAAEALAKMRRMPGWEKREPI